MGCSYLSASKQGFDPTQHIAAPAEGVGNQR